MTKVHKLWIALAGSLILAGSLGALGASGTPAPQSPPPTSANPASAGLPHREAGGDARSPDISFIDSASPTCHLPVAGTGACYIEWSYLYVEAAAGSSIISMTVTIDDHVRAYHAGFFQTSMYIPGDMTKPGYKVSCGELGSGGTPNLGAAYAYTIRARETSGLSSANYGTVSCPADVARGYLPMIQQR
jgi:hypothetical protein